MYPDQRWLITAAFAFIFLGGCPDSDDDVTEDDDSDIQDDDTADDDVEDDDTISDDDADDDTADDDTADDDTEPLNPNDLAAIAEIQIVGEGDVDTFGLHVSTSGDVNGDGLDDIAIIAPEGGTDQVGGIYYVVFGRTSGWPSSAAAADVRMTGEDPTADYFRGDIEIVGDLNGDGLDDLATSEVYWPEGGPNRGKAYLLFGRAEGWPATLSGADVHIYGMEDYGYFGETISMIGDVTGDSNPDLLISATGGFATVSVGRVYVFEGGATTWPSTLQATDALATIVGVHAGDRTGSSVSHGDVNGDGLQDLVIGAEYYNTNLQPTGNHDGRIYVIYGRTSLWPEEAEDADLVWTGGTIDWLGSSVSADGDVNGDGYDDLLLGASHASYNYLNISGRVYLILGRDSGWPEDLSAADAFFDGQLPGDLLGASVEICNDLDGDGLHDIALFSTAIYEDGDSYISDGITHVIFGRSSGWPTTLFAADHTLRGEHDSWAGIGLAADGDLDGNGNADLIIGAIRYQDLHGKVYGLLSLP